MQLRLLPETIRTIFAGLKTSTLEHLYLPRQRWAEERLGHRIRFDVKLGSGGATYHRSDRKKQKFSIVYGAKLIEDSFVSEGVCGWRSMRELRETYAKNREITPLDHLAHVVIHEFGHWVQVVLGGRYENSVHNTEFYMVLDKAYAKGIDVKVREHIHSACKNNVRLLHALSRPYDFEAHLGRSELRMGMELIYRTKENAYQACKVLRVNKTRVVAQTPCGLMRIPISRLRRPQQSDTSNLNMNGRSLRGASIEGRISS